MSNIDTRSPFFPRGKTAQTDSTQKQSQTGAVTRNDPARMNEIQARTSGDANVQIADGVKDFSRIKKAVDASPEIDNSEKIAQLKARIQAGQYQIDYDGLADKMLEQENF
jgi:negative regulator of flagellin synthesis FlgM